YRALSVLFSTVDETIFSQIMMCETAKQVWKKLKSDYRGTDKTKQMRLLNLRKQFDSLRMSETEGIKDYVDRMSTLVNQMRLLGDNVTYQRIVEKISVTVSSHFDSTITSLEAVTNFSALSVSDLISALESVEV
ncbi:hypothetical protein M569_09912, partial [Genlisea aurea]